MNFGRTEKHRFISAYHTIYTVPVKMMGFLRLKKIISLLSHPSTNFSIFELIPSQCNNNSYFEKVVLWWESASNNEKRKWSFFHNSTNVSEVKSI